LAFYKRKIKSLEAKLKRVRHTKRKKVKVNPNTQFTNIKTIRASQRAVGRNPVEDSDLEEDGDFNNIEDYIQVL